MGNCMETNRIKGFERGESWKGKGKGKGNGVGLVGKEVDHYVKDIEKNKNGLRVKMVLTKEELQWLMMQLRNREEGVKNIEDVLGEIEKGRIKKVSSNNGHSWIPSLDSINEIPELLEVNK